MIIHYFTLSLNVSDWSGDWTRQKKVTYLSIGNTIQLEYIDAFYVFCGISFVNTHPNDGIIYCAFLIEYVWNSA